ncbi:MAG TPA: hypothetical protein PLP33_24575 [Leptospiraceae bacterium]|nr:hypothetical protein [Leptospiraceae bacterium]
MLILALKYAIMADNFKDSGKVVDSLIYAGLAQVAFRCWKKELNQKLLTA